MNNFFLLTEFTKGDIWAMYGFSYGFINQQDRLDMEKQMHQLLQPSDYPWQIRQKFIQQLSTMNRQRPSDPIKYVPAAELDEMKVMQLARGVPLSIGFQGL